MGPLLHIEELGLEFLHCPTRMRRNRGGKHQLARPAPMKNASTIVIRNARPMALRKAYAGGANWD
jgi:hypothetical protein